ncbi:MAG TPA: hypothetical protein VLF91_04225 [Candidatus Saccharimonadales bacterium]|nr:hypothetical protein [Candidatus Saccharimonadales bacterium]
MEAANQPTSSNDYAVAKALNESIMGIIILVVIAKVVDAPEDHEIEEINRAYILLAHELQTLYDRNPGLAAIKPEPIWKHFDVIKTSSWNINEHLNNPDNDFGNAHNARVEKLCIITGKETPDFSPEQKKLIDHAESIIYKHGKMLDKFSANWRAKRENNWYIPEYALTYKPDGTILINDVLRLKKAHAGSTTERLLEQALKNPDTLFKPDLGQTARNISTVLNSAGFTPVLRQLFFPTVSKSNGIVFRPVITRDQADADNINTKELDLALKELGAVTKPKSSN